MVRLVKDERALTAEHHIEELSEDERILRALVPCFEDHPRRALSRRGAWRWFRSSNIYPMERYTHLRPLKRRDDEAA